MPPINNRVIDVSIKTGNDQKAFRPIVKAIEIKINFPKCTYKYTHKANELTPTNTSNIALPAINYKMNTTERSRKG